jgi:hypothetical protein
VWKFHYQKVDFRQRHFGSKAVIVSVTGTETDPQGYSQQV